MLLATLLHPDSIVLYTGAGILNSIALSPLLLSTIGLLGRVNDSLRHTEKRAFSPRTFRLLSIPTVTGLGLCVAGGTLTGISGDPTNVHITTKIGVILFVVAFAVMNFITAITYRNLSYAEAGERQLGRVVAVSAPFLIVRTVYSVLGAFGNNLKFNILIGSVPIYLCMAVLEEFAIFVLFIAVGFTLRVIPKDYEATSTETAFNFCETEG
ncbi:hypothetical protein V501_00499 [Pseudogymnoascus sp. VKM F-4519 (FW-2642)]|nr:hypothetical protein V501_00499 [Pseudogymnoascus sp. VKM F-4519 (FW-2642)]